MSKIGQEKTALNERQSKALLAEYGIPVVREKVVHHPSEAAEAADQLGYPVVIKGMGKTLLHKTEQGLVHMNLQDQEQVYRAAQDIALKAGNALEGLLVQPQIQGKRELVAGLFQDPQFGPVVMFGIGGIFVWLFWRRVVSAKLIPVNDPRLRNSIDIVS